MEMCSPRTWGWSCDPSSTGNDRDVLPTHVGMVRAQNHAVSPASGAPHARGDGPLCAYLLL